MDLTEVIIIIIVAIVFLAVGFFLGIAYRKKIGEAMIGSAEEKAKTIINEAIKLADTKQKEALLEAKEEIHKTRSEAEKEIRDRRNESITWQAWSSRLPKDTSGKSPLPLP